MTDKINENGIELSRLLALAGLKPTLIVLPSTSPEKDVAEDEVEDEVEEVMLFAIFGENIMKLGNTLNHFGPF